MSASPVRYTGSLRTRSNQTPEGRERTTNGVSSAAVSRPISVGEACKSTAAVSGSASNMT